MGGVQDVLFGSECGARLFGVIVAAGDDFLALGAAFIVLLGCLAGVAVALGNAVAVLVAVAAGQRDGGHGVATGGAALAGGDE